MRHHDHGHAPARQIDHDVEDLVDHLGVQGGGGLVEQHRLGVHGERAGDGDALLLAAGELRGDLMRLGRDAHALEQLHRALLRLGLGQAQHLDRADRHVLQDAHVREQIEALEHHAELGAHGGELAALLRQRDALDEHLAGVDGLEAVDRAAHRGLAGTGRPDDDEDLAAGDGKVDVAQDMQVTEMLVNMAELDDGGVLFGMLGHGVSSRMGAVRAG